MPMSTAVPSTEAQAVKFTVLLNAVANCSFVMCCIGVAGHIAWYSDANCSGVTAASFWRNS
eukprot:CAMPEP_0114625570 /NCGR_PEP_ID=MMETSP0168-20121206/11337_1 /TAXON_ID=95228 ORGANISM="Vannella sp., Strain DIVA3 517/6/12" /NCGR_SAMPLE_ID=MMETSP0168 /ASSEMBLY_ACC=CAM_ASM_000044 /LENGTH=60 /DNA_ID=CAMNT_0001836853 /DNA_START=236 /DNA_END=418 /DNA_ORIENTATION=-